MAIAPDSMTTLQGIYLGEKDEKTLHREIKCIAQRERGTMSTFEKTHSSVELMDLKTIYGRLVKQSRVGGYGTPKETLFEHVLAELRQPENFEAYLAKLEQYGMVEHGDFKRGLRYRPTGLAERLLGAGRL